jgi:condensin complex subunit 3
MYTILRNGLVEGACDKESIVRSYAVTALSKLVCSEDPNDLEVGEKSVAEIVLDSLCLDPAASVSCFL